jgi:hypothetical protein
MIQQRRPFYPASKSPQPIKVSQPCPKKIIVPENIIPKLDFHDRTLNLSCHGPIKNQYKIERYTSMQTVEALQDFNIMYPCDVYIFCQSSKLQTYLNIQTKNKECIHKNASESAIEEALKTEFLINSKAKKIKDFRLKLQKRLALEESCKREEKGTTNLTRIPNVIVK